MFNRRQKILDLNKRLHKLEVKTLKSAMMAGGGEPNKVNPAEQDPPTYEETLKGSKGVKNNADNMEPNAPPAYFNVTSPSGDTNNGFFGMDGATNKMTDGGQQPQIGKFCLGHILQVLHIYMIGRLHFNDQFCSNNGKIFCNSSIQNVRAEILAMLWDLNL